MSHTYRNRVALALWFLEQLDAMGVLELADDQGAALAHELVALVPEDFDEPQPTTGD